MSEECLDDDIIESEKPTIPVVNKEVGCTRVIPDRMVFKVKSTANVKKLAEAIYRTFMEGTRLEVQSIGSSAVNQSIKACIEARSKLIQAGHNVLLLPFYRDVQLGDKHKSAIVFLIKEVEG